MRLADVCKKVRGAALAGALGFVLLAIPARAQYIGQVSQASAIDALHTGLTGVQVILGPCTGAQTTNCIDMIGQAGHLVTVNYAAATACAVWLDGSGDGSHWVTLAAILIPGNAAAQPWTMTANGYYALLRLKVNPGGNYTCGAMTFTYAGFQTPLPLSPVTATWNGNSITTPHLFANTPHAAANPYLVQGLQCFNPNAGVAWLALYDSVVQPTLGTTPFIYEIGIPAGGIFTYPAGNAFVGVNLLWAAAATAESGGTAVGTPVVCNAQIGYGGPFAPFNPPSP